MRTIAYKGGGMAGLILAIFVRTYYVDDPIPTWLENAVFWLFLAGQEYFKSWLFLCQAPLLNFSFCSEAVLPLHERTKIRNLWNMNFCRYGNDANSSYWDF